jgi:hypothetical protein
MNKKILKWALSFVGIYIGITTHALALPCHESTNENLTTGYDERSPHLLASPCHTSTTENREPYNRQIGETTLTPSFHVSPTGNDHNDGARDNPFATIPGALKQIKALRADGKLHGNVELIVQEGEYRITHPIIITPSVWDGNDTLFIKAEKGNSPIIKGSISLGKFQRVSENLWEMDLSHHTRLGTQNFQQLFINGQRATRARTPDFGTLFKTGKVQEIKLDSNNTVTGGWAVQKLFLDKEQFDALKPAFPEIPNVIVSIHHAWDRTRKFVQNISMEDSSVFIINRPMPPWNRLDNSSQFYFENSRHFLDSPGEWFVDAGGTLFYVPRPGEEISLTEAEIPVLNQLLVINGNEEQQVANIVFENISFQHTRHVMPIRGEDPNQAAALYTASIELNYTDNIVFNQCEIANVSNYAIWYKTGCRSGEISRCHIHDLGMGGIKIGNITYPANEREVTSHILIDNNIIRSGGFENPTGVGVIIFHASDNTVSHNDIADFRYTGISVGWVWGYTPSVAKRNKIIYNHIHHLGWGELSDMGGVYTLGLSEGTVVNNNVIHDIYSYGYGGWGLYTDEGSTGIVMENNLVYNCKSSGFHQHYGKENIIRNNIFAFNMISQLQATRVEPHRSLSFTNNIIYFDSGFLLGKSSGGNWHAINLTTDNNCYWDTRTENILFRDISFNDWQAQGKDIHSVIADPGFVNPKQFDFNFKNRRVIRKIGFKPFDYKKAGVYGEESWVEKAKLPAQVMNAYNETITKKMKELD